jgi:hypothetical protein
LGGSWQSFHLIVDEVHIGLDDFTRSNTKLTMLKQAISSARSVIFMTGTFPETQRLMLAQQVSECCGRRLTEETYCCYEFPPVKSNPLSIHPLKRFQVDFVDMLQEYANLKNTGHRLPRVMVLLPTSRMEKFRILVSNSGLDDVAMIVSRQESPDEEIELARVGDRPILITSPLFSVGLNLEVQLERLWCSFEHIKADTSRIIQTINRGNRGQVQCEVRIYSAWEDDRPYNFPNRDVVRGEIEAALNNESSLMQTGFELPLFLDRVTYNEFRRAEIDTNKAMGQLIRDESFQNYRVVENVESAALTKEEEERESSFKAAGKQAREAYNEAVLKRF